MTKNAHFDLESVLAHYDRLLSQHKYDDGEHLLRATLKQVEDQFGSDSIEFARVLDALAQGCKELENFSEAKRYLTRSLEIKTRVAGREHPDVAAALRRLAFCLDANDCAERDRMMAEAKAIEVKAGITCPLERILSEMDDITKAVRQIATADLVNDVPAQVHKSGQRYKAGDALLCRVREKEPGGYALAVLGDGCLGFLATDKELEIDQQVEALFVSMHNGRLLLSMRSQK